MDTDQSYVAAGVYARDEYSPQKPSGKVARRELLKRHNKLISEAVKVQKQSIKIQNVPLKMTVKKSLQGSLSGSKQKEETAYLQEIELHRLNNTALTNINPAVDFSKVTVTNS